MRELSCTAERWEMKSPFRITGYTFTHAQLIHVSITQNGFRGRGEAAGVYYLGEDLDSMSRDVERVRATIERGADRQALRELLPAGGARNAIDCALWDLEAKQSGQSVWNLAGIEPSTVISVNTVGVDSPERMAEMASRIDSPKIKVKLDGEGPLERIAAVCRARPDAEIVVDINQGWTFEQLVDLAPRFRDLGVTMIEQPLPRGGDAALEGYRPPIPLCADESCLHTGEFEQAARRYQMINIKLDKTGGLTEALDLVQMARKQGIGLMVGNMGGTSLGMAPGYIVAQMCRFIDLDGPLFLKRDRKNPVVYTGGTVSIPAAQLWG